MYIANRRETSALKKAVCDHEMIRCNYNSALQFAFRTKTFVS